MLPKVNTPVTVPVIVLSPKDSTEQLL